MASMKEVGGSAGTRLHRSAMSTSSRFLAPCTLSAIRSASLAYLFE